MIDQITNNEITNSVKKNFKDRFSSPVFGTFFIWWVIFHWEFVYAMFFVDESRVWRTTNMLMNDYLRARYFHIDWSFVFFWLAPFVMTFVTIWWFPRFILIPLFRKWEEYESEKQIIKIKIGRKIEEETVKRLEVTSQKIEKEKKIEEADPSINLEREYLQFRKSDFFNNFKRLIESIYKHHGYVSTVNFEVPRDILAYTHSNGLVEFEDNNRKIHLTEKGKYFVKQYSLHNK
ncbi:MAG: hypothetical protein CO042_03250 [Parcubacteria group bacterium CG_4_9_14_0_2_um_filter_41_8]|nr:MAG: hypothetical protein COV79_05110 [Parcubacteria group bacterium CG11_big_fil_rev_8_21_14_0_20_41_14]PJC40539.1 MAG: hypothetical protein CO042_03250 [Parcubacteria group bacterium CG_4_9_14_0_2_um_filter_41_8]